jgi:large subunit ribosomal protein L5
MFTSVSEKQIKAFDVLKEKFGYTNIMQSPKIDKVIVSIGVGSVTDKNKLKDLKAKLALITGQKPSEQLAKKSIATFKVRQGQLSGYKVTLRNKSAIDFVDKLIHISLPRTRDFRGLERSSIDEMGNYTLGIKENAIFAETADQDVKDSFGLGITIVTTSKSKQETEAFLEYLGFPFKSVDKIEK